VPKLKPKSQVNKRKGFFKVQERQRLQKENLIEVTKHYCKSLMKQMSNEFGNEKEFQGKCSPLSAEKFNDWIQQQSIQDLVLQTEPILQQTYSYKYFGVNKGQFGILSKRFPLLGRSNGFQHLQKSIKTRKFLDTHQKLSHLESHGQKALITSYMLPKKLIAYKDSSRERRRMGRARLNLRKKAEIKRDQLLVKIKEQNRLKQQVRGVYRNLQFSLNYKRFKDQKIRYKKKIKDELQKSFDSHEGRIKKFSYSSLLGALEDHKNKDKNKIQYKVFQQVARRAF
jgi:hypothetical protein